MQFNYRKFALLTIIIFITLSIGLGCFERNIVKPLCPPPEGAESFICAKSAEMGIAPEQVYGWIYSASAIGAVADIMTIDEICEFKGKVDERYLRLYPLSYDTAIAEVFAELELVKDPKKLLLIKNILNQNLELYSSPEMIGEYDDMMLRKGSVRFERDMLCELE